MIAKLLLLVYSLFFPQCQIHVYTGPMHVDRAGEFSYVYEWVVESYHANSFKEPFRLDADWARSYDVEHFVLHLPFVMSVCCRRVL